jgi:hypothetical protein
MCDISRTDISTNLFYSHYTEMSALVKIYQGRLLALHKQNFMVRFGFILLV